ncbi:MAG TPA: NB-ARC domain-containing protein, partial [Ktedonobacteraceae bacterium]|nr:NB-ARC domain-containing protein [Ktedonobacteraceae bacterium]
MALRRARESKCLSQQQMAELLDTSTFTISRWERGLTLPGPYFRQKLCALFECSPDALGLIHDSASDTVLQATSSRSHGEPLVDRSMYPPFPHAFDVPALFPMEGLVGREELLARLIQELLTERALAMVGLPGVGKTALAVAIAQHPTVTKEFTDGVLWVSLGPSPDLGAILISLGTQLGMPLGQLSRLSGIKAMTQGIWEVIGSKRLLLVVDDAWKPEDALVFRMGGSSGYAAVVTTRFPQTASYFAENNVVHVDELTEDNAVTLLTRSGAKVLQDDQPAVHLLAQSVGGLPLPLILMGRYLRAETYSGQPRRIRE